MIYIEKIKVIGNSYPGSHVLQEVDFTLSDINLFVGDQGCGKSTLINLIRLNHGDIDLKMTEHTIQNGVDSFFFDSEKDNPRTKDPIAYTKPTGESIGYGYGNALASRFKSHGEILEHFIISPLLKAKDCVILLDEPESGLSITNQFKMINAIKTAAKNNCQLFIATHCYPLIMEFEVISLEHNMKLNGKDFINKIINKHVYNCLAKFTPRSIRRC